MEQFADEVELRALAIEPQLLPILDEGVVDRDVAGPGIRRHEEGLTISIKLKICPQCLLRAGSQPLGQGPVGVIRLVPATQLHVVIGVCMSGGGRGHLLARTHTCIGHASLACSTHKLLFA